MLHAGLFAPVVGVGIQHNAAVAGPAGDHIRARADGLGAVHTKLVACFLHVLLAHDGAGSGCQLIQETGKRLRQGNGKVGVINHLNAFQVGGGAIHHSFRTGNGRAIIRLHAVRQGQHTGKGILDIVGGQRGAVRERNTAAQGEIIGQAVVRNGVVFHQALLQLSGAVRIGFDLKQAVKDIQRHHVVVVGLVHIHRLDIGVHGNVQRTICCSPGGSGSFGGRCPGIGGCISGGSRRGGGCGAAAGSQHAGQQCSAQRSAGKFFHNSFPLLHWRSHSAAPLIVLGLNPRPQAVKTHNVTA